MTFAYILLFLIALELLAVNAVLVYGVLHDKLAFGRKAPEEEESAETRRAKELEEAWNKGVNSILGYDMTKAGEAVKRYGENEGE